MCRAMRSVFGLVKTQALISPIYGPDNQRIIAVGKGKADFFCLSRKITKVPGVTWKRFKNVGQDFSQHG